VPTVPFVTARMSEPYRILWMIGNLNISRFWKGSVRVGDHASGTSFASHAY